MNVCLSLHEIRRYKLSECSFGVLFLGIFAECDVSSNMSLIYV